MKLWICQDEGMKFKIQFKISFYHCHTSTLTHFHIMNIKKPHLFLFLLLTTLSGSSQTVNQDSAWFRDNYYKMEKAITMRDGVKLFTSIYLPRDSTDTSR